LKVVGHFLTTLPFHADAPVVHRQPGNKQKVVIEERL